MDKFNVAIADDNEKMLRLLGDIVAKDAELEVVGTAKDGVEAYELIKNKQPDVMLMDLIMPKMDGLSVMDLVNRDKEIKKRPSFIIVTAVGQERITSGCFSLIIE